MVNRMKVLLTYRNRQEPFQRRQVFYRCSPDGVSVLSISLSQKNRSIRRARKDSEAQSCSLALCRKKIRGFVYPILSLPSEMLATVVQS